MNHFICQRVENCFSKTAVFQYQLPVKMGDEFLQQFERVGNVRCRRDFPRPYFNIALSDGTAVKGVLNDVALKVIFPLVTADDSKASFEQLLISIVVQCQSVKE